LRKHLSRLDDSFRSRLSTFDGLISVSILAIMTGLITGLVIILFRTLIESSQAAFLPGGNVEAYEDLSLMSRFFLPLIGGLLLGLLLQQVPKKYHAVGVVHVMSALARQHGRLQFPNALVQFFAAALCLICGHSVGREGPGVHLGAACGSLLGQALRLPNNTVRTLLACGVAASIAASFNTPLAGVIFSMEVILMEYTIVGFVPVIIAAVVATTLMQLYFGAEPILLIDPVNITLTTFSDIPYICMMGLIIGLIAVIFIDSLKFFGRQLQNIPIWQRTTFAGALTGLIAIIAPQIMGVGYDTMTSAINGELALTLLALIIVAKLLATTAGLGLGFPGGLIGPTVFLGALIGSGFGILHDGASSSTIGLFALLGMGAMMSATLNAPLAALTAIIELSANPAIILPGMTAIVIANLTCGQLFGRQSIYLILLQNQGIQYHIDPVSQHLRRTRASSLMSGDVVISNSGIMIETFLPEIHNYHIKWVYVPAQKNQKFGTLFPANELRAHLNEMNEINEMTEKTHPGHISLLELPVSSNIAPEISLTASALEAFEAMQTHHTNTVVVAHAGPFSPALFGALSRQDITDHLHLPPLSRPPTRQ